MLNDKYNKEEKVKCTCAVEIELPAAKVVQLFDDRRNPKNWQGGFVSIEHDLPPLMTPLLNLESME
jgi:hypothetical protein